MNDNNINQNDVTKNNSMKNKKVFIPLLLLLAVIVIGTSFALWQLTFTQSSTNVITTGCLKLTLTEDTDAINIIDALPLTDSEGKKLDPFTFTLENVCTTEARYVVNLETLSTGDKILDDYYIKADLISGDNELFIDNLQAKYINEEKVISDATTAYKLYKGKLGNKEKKSFSLRLWMDEDTEALDAVMDALWQGRITVTATYIPIGAMKNVMKQMEIYEDIDYVGSGIWITYLENYTYTNSGKYKLSKVGFQSVMNPYENAVEVVDFSEAEDESVLGYYVKDITVTDSEKYILYIQADGKIKVNPIASYWFFYLGTDGGDIYPYIEFDGIENLDTSNVTDMSNMFYNYQGDTINISTFDTSQVTNMYQMFYSLKLKNIILGDFDTSNVTNMIDMFTWSSTITVDITKLESENYAWLFGTYANDLEKIILNYTEDTSDLVDQMIATKPESLNIVKGTLIS